MKVPKISD